jgi:hypothetical protein
LQTIEQLPGAGVQSRYTDIGNRESEVRTEVLGKKIVEFRIDHQKTPGAYTVGDTTPYLRKHIRDAASRSDQEVLFLDIDNHCFS